MLLDQKRLLLYENHVTYWSSHCMQLHLSHAASAAAGSPHPPVARDPKAAATRLDLATHKPERNIQKQSTTEPLEKCNVTYYNHPLNI